MRRLRVETAGESHGRAALAIVGGLPAGLAVDLGAVNADLARRQRGYGRGGRMAIEADVADFLAGVRHGRTIGAPVVVAVWNRDFADWQPDLAAFEAPGQEPTRPAVRRPRPGHADLAGAQKTGAHDLRDVLERASARETAARVAAGALARQLLAAFGVRVRSQVLAIGGARAAAADLADDDAWAAVEASDVRCADEGAAAAMREAVDAAREAGDSLGGVGGAVALGVPPGLGGYESWEARLDGRLAAAAMSVPSVKAVELGDGWASAGRPGSAVHDEIVNDHSCPWGLRRRSNRAGGVEGGVSNGEAVVVRAAFKPIPTLTRPLSSVDLDTGQAAAAHAERSDVCIVPAGCVVLEAMVALVLADALVEKLGGDCMADMLAAHGAYLARLGGAFGCDA